jgi:hypothetical protein
MKNKKTVFFFLIFNQKKEEIETQKTKNKSKMKTKKVIHCLSLIDFEKIAQLTGKFKSMGKQILENMEKRHKN